MQTCLHSLSLFFLSITASASMIITFSSKKYLEVDKEVRQEGVNGFRWPSAALLNPAEASGCYGSINLEGCRPSLLQDAEGE